MGECNVVISNSGNTSALVLLGRALESLGTLLDYVPLAALVSVLFLSRHSEVVA